MRPQEGDSQLHSSLAGGNPAQGGIAGEGVVVPALLDAVPPLPDAAPAPLEAAPAAEPYPPLFALVDMLQNVAVISSLQIIPVFGRVDVFVWPPVPSCCCRGCAATGEAAKSSAVVNANIFIR
jgi:hypothetical protein